MPNRKRRILCVDDHKEMCELLTIFLSAYDVQVTHTMANALQVIEAEAFDLYVLDNWLDDGSGVALCRQIRAADAHTPIIFVSAAVRAEDQQEALAAGAQAYITKPLDPEQLAQTVNRLLRRTDLQNLEARLVEIEAVRDHVAERIACAEGKLEQAKEGILRLHAFKAFMAAGGSRAGFERMWPGIYQTEILLGGEASS